MYAGPILDWYIQTSAWLSELSIVCCGCRRLLNAIRDEMSVDRFEAAKNTAIILVAVRPRGPEDPVCPSYVDTPTARDKPPPPWSPL